MIFGESCNPNHGLFFYPLLQKLYYTADLNDDGTINSEDRKIVGKPDPDFIIGLGNSINYRNFRLDFFINGDFGNQLYNQTKAQFGVPSVVDISNLLVYATGYWTPSNPDSNVPANTANNGGNFMYNSKWIEDAWFIRLNNVTLTYNIPTIGFFNNIFDKASIYIQGQNLFLITDYSGIDPDAANNSFIPATENQPAFIPGSVDYEAYPSSRTFTVGVNLTF